MVEVGSLAGEAQSVDLGEDLSDEPVIRVAHLRKSFAPNLVAVSDFSLEVAPGEIVSLLGPSGCGKTTVLRSIAGLEQPDDGAIEVDRRQVFSHEDGLSLPPEKRDVSMVFQQYALWPHMNVFENVAFGLRTRKKPRAQIESQVERALRQVQLWDKRNQRISQLSGGQQQRAAFARAIAFDPRVVLLDEPLSSLDAKLREEMRIEFLALQRTIGFSALYVTHDQEEAMALSSRIVVMSGGRIEQVGRPLDVWKTPATKFVASFIGSANRLAGVAVDRSGADEVRVRTTNGPVLTVPGAGDLQPGQEVELYVRSGDIALSLDTGADDEGWPGLVKLVTFQGESTVAQVEFGDGTLMVRPATADGVQEGQQVRVTIDPQVVRWYPA